MQFDQPRRNRTLCLHVFEKWCPGTHAKSGRHSAWALALNDLQLVLLFAVDWTILPFASTSAPGRCRGGLGKSRRNHPVSQWQRTRNLNVKLKTRCLFVCLLACLFVCLFSLLCLFPKQLEL